MMPILADHNFNDAIVQGLQRAWPTVDVVRAIEVGLDAVPDVVLPEWAASQGRVVLTHDRRSMILAINALGSQIKPVPRVVIVRTDITIGSAMEDIRILLECGMPEDWPQRYRFIPI
ncbi:MAG: DUF5615 family PIN-like protein [Gemmataceae bacterium]|nr:DUF5615 family PIN-like protein [Gemmataceae bacterium]